MTARYSEAHNKANQRYQAKAYDRIYIRVRKGKKETYEDLARLEGKSLAGLITDLLNQAAGKAGLMDPSEAILDDETAEEEEG